MKLDETQKKTVSHWIEEGLSLSKIQDKLATEFGLRMTYMEVRFLIDDLGVKLKDVPKETAPAQVNAPGKGAPGTQAPPKNPSLTEETDSVRAGVSVTVDQVTRPGALASGKVKFSDSKSAEWYLD